MNNILPNGPFFPQTNIFLSLKGQTRFTCGSEADAKRVKRKPY